MLILSVNQAQLINQRQHVTLYFSKQETISLKKLRFVRATNLDRTQRAYLTNLITCLFLDFLSHT